MKIFNGILVGNAFKDLTGQKFNRLTVINFSHIKKERYYWLCECECGKETTVRAGNIRQGHTKSCGCMHNGPLNRVTKINDKTLGVIIESKKYENKICLIDSEDYEKIKNYRWCLVKNTTSKYKDKFYVAAQFNKKTIKLHKLILDTKQQVDHINRDTLDNRKENLREATQQKNCFNKQKIPLKYGKLLSSKYKGVSWHKPSKKWVARIVFNLKHIFLGYFCDEKDAAKAYNFAAIEYFGEFACLNVIED